MTKKEWYQHNNIAVKLRDGLENVVNGQGLPYVFAGLDSGKCTVEIVYNGETCVFYNKNPAPVTLIVPPVINDKPTFHEVVGVVEDTEVYNTEFEPKKEPATKGKRIKKVTPEPSPGDQPAEDPVFVGGGIKKEW